jgi:aminoglycoside 6-adenylyltransferase
VEPFKDEKYILNHFGEIIIIQKPEDKIFPPPINDGRYNYNIQFLDGNRIDLTFFDLTKKDFVLKDSLTVVLLDKDNILSELPPPNESSYYIKEPSEKLFLDVCNEFIFGISSHIPKTIWRRELPLLKFYIEFVLRKSLLKMFEWKIGIKTDFKRAVGKAGRFLKKYLEPEIWKDFKQTYTDSNYDNIWKSLFIFADLFKNTAEFVSRKYGFQFPGEEFSKAISFLEHVKKLPQSVSSIY